MGAIIRWVVSKLSAYLAELQRQIEAYEKEKAEKEARVAALRQANVDLNNQITQEQTLRGQLDIQLATEKAAINDTESQLKDALTPKTQLVLSDDDELRRISQRTD